MLLIHDGVLEEGHDPATGANFGGGGRGALSQ